MYKSVKEGVIIMVGLGTVINSAAVAVGGIIGLYGKKLMKNRYRETLQSTCGICVLFIGAAGALEKMFSVNNGVITSGYSIFITICLVLGALIGEIINIEHWFENFGEWLKSRTSSSDDSSFVDAFLNASFTVSIGAMAIVGALEDGISGDWSILAVKSVLDFIIILVMTCSMGRGCIFSAIPVFVFEGLITVFAVFIKPFMTDLALNYISMVGSILIFCIGINLVWGKKIRVANLLPAVLIATTAAFLPNL